jgi:hypothetical protein
VRGVADVEADLAEDDLFPDRHERCCEHSGLGLGGSQEVVGQALGGLGPDPGKAVERLDEPGDRLDERARHGA